MILPLLISMFISCGSDPEEPNKSMEVGQEEPIVKVEDETDDSFPEFELVIDSMVGIWKLAEIRMAPTTKGIAPVTGGNDILMQITSNYKLAIATDGIEELKMNIRGIPSDITISENMICGNDIIFKSQFKGECAKVLMVNNKELLIEIDLSERIGEGFMYKYFTRVN